MRSDAGKRAAKTPECLWRGQGLFYPKTPKDNVERAKGQKTDYLLLCLAREAAGVWVSE